MKQLIIALAFGAAMTLPSWAGITIGSTSYSADTLFRRQIGPGIVNTIIRIPDYPLNVYLLEADMSNPYNRVETTVGQGRLGSLELLTAAAKRVSTSSKRVVAGCNANFWCVSSQSDAAYMLGSPYGAVVRNDTTYLNTNNVNDTWDGGPSRTGAVAIDHNKQLYMGHFTWKAAVAATKLGTALEINKVNRRNLDNEMCLWNEAYGRTREFEDDWTSAGARGTNNADNYYLDFAQGSGWNVNRAMTMVVKKVVTDADRLTLGNYTACITATGSYKAKMRALAVGDTITVNQGWTTSEPDAQAVAPWIENMVEGNAPVMHHGQLTSRNTDESYNSQVYSRTGYGASADGRKLYMIVIDKSKSALYGQSAGCSTTVMCNILQSLFPDISEVVNFDAGGSAQMLVDGKIVNTTTESIPRAVAAGWFLESTAPADSVVASIQFADPQLRLPIYSSYTPQVIGYNQYGDIVNEHVAGFTLSCDSTLGTASGSQFTASGTATRGLLTASYHGLVATLPVTTMPAQPAIASRSLLVDGRSWLLPVTATVDGVTYHYDSSRLDWKVEDESVASVTSGKIRGLANGTTRVMCRIGELADTAAVTVEMADSAYLHQRFDGWTLKGSGASSLSLSASGVLSYTYTASRAPYIKLLKDVTFYSLPDTVGLTFTSSVPLDYVQVDVRNASTTSANYQKFDNNGSGYEAGRSYTVRVDLDGMGGAGQLTTYPLTVKELRFGIDKSKATTGEQSLVVDSFYGHYQLPARGDVNGDGVVNQSDVTALISNILGLSSYPAGLCDINGDALVNVTDAGALVNRILGR